MSCRNYFEIRKISLRYCHFCYVDTSEYLADRVFIRRKINVRFGEEWGHNESNYVVIFCKIKKKDRDNFLEALKELENKMLILGNSDYIDFCNRLQITYQERGKKVC